MCEIKGSALIIAFLHGLCKLTREANGVNIVFIMYTVYVGKNHVSTKFYTLYCIFFGGFLLVTTR